MAISTRFDAISKAIDQRQAIPSKYRKTLEERLVLACKPLPRLPRQETRRPKGEIKAYAKTKKAQGVYLEVLDIASHMFLPLILTVSPNACQSFDVDDFCQRHRANHIRLGPAVQTILNEIANDYKISQSPHYMKLVECLFPKPSIKGWHDDCIPLAVLTVGKVPLPQPVTTAESEKQWAYYAANIDCIRMIFGDQICDAVERAPMRLRERATQTLRVTQCVRTSFSRHNFQDAVISLDIGPAQEFARILFPQTKCFTVPPTNEQAVNEGVPEDNAYFTLLGASVSAIGSIFHPQVCHAIEKSQLRAWEMEHRLLDTTDCVTMNVRREDPQYGTIRLRVEFLNGIDIVKPLYAEPVPSESIIRSSTSL